MYDGLGPNQTGSSSLDEEFEDMNAKLDGKREGLGDIRGPHGLSNEINDNGDRLSSFCNINNLRIGNIYHPHKSIHNRTWRSPDEQTFNEIYYICLSKRWISRMQDVGVFGGADAGSDHILLLGKSEQILKI